MTNKPSWEEKIRQDYAGILSNEQIEDTIKYWGETIKQELQSAFDEVEKTLIYKEKNLGNIEYNSCLAEVKESIKKIKEKFL